MTDDLQEMGTVHIVDDDADVRHSLEWTLRSVGYSVSTHPSAQDFLSRGVLDDAKCLVVDLLLPGMSGLKLCEHLTSDDYACGIVMISGQGDISSAVTAMKLGAVDFLEKPCSRQELLDAVHLAFTRARTQLSEREREQGVLQKLQRLTTREQEVFHCIAAGMVSKQIAKELNISRRTVDVHRSNIINKLEISSHTQLGHLISVAARVMPPVRSDA